MTFQTNRADVPQAGVGCFFAMCLVVGLIAAYFLWPMARHEHRSITVYRETTCLITEARLVEVRGKHRSTWRPEFSFVAQLPEGPRPVTGYSVWNSALPDRNAQAVLERHQPGQHDPCWYDPAEPERVVLMRDFGQNLYIPILAPLALLLVGVGGLGWGMWRLSRPRTRGTDAADAPPAPAWLPTSRATRGERLAWRLVPERYDGRGGLRQLVFAIIWNVGMGGGLVLTLLDPEGRDEWLLLFIFSLLSLLGLAMLFGAVHNLLLGLRVRATVVEVSRQPLQPGASFELRVEQHGRMHLESLTVQLVCEEQTTRHQGRRQTHTATQRVWALPVERRTQVELRPGAPFVLHSQVALPPNVMHSLALSGNTVTWALEVKGEFKGWPAFVRTFGLVVAPGGVR